MKNGKIPYSGAELEIIKFSAEDVLTTSFPNIDEEGTDWGTDNSGDSW